MYEQDIDVPHYRVECGKHKMIYSYVAFVNVNILYCVANNPTPPIFY